MARKQRAIRSIPPISSTGTATATSRGTNKLNELRPLLQSGNWEVLSLNDFPEIGDIWEDGSSLEENALIKAREVQAITGYPALADDTGLEVEEL